LKKVSILSLLALLALSTPLAYGSMQLSYSLDGAPRVICATTGSAGPASCVAVAVGDVNMLLFGGVSNSPGSAGGAFELGTTLQVTSGSAHTLELWIVSQDFTAPVTPPAIDFFSNSSGTAVGGSNSVVLQSCVGPNALIPTTPFCTGGTVLNNSAISLVGPGGSDENSVATTIGSLSAPYAISQHITMTLSAGANLNTTTSSILVPIPEPASMMLLGSALLGLTVAFRKKLAKRS
jgi:hypothetical protein